MKLKEMSVEHPVYNNDTTICTDANPVNVKRHRNYVAVVESLCPC